MNLMGSKKVKLAVSRKKLAQAVVAVGLAAIIAGCQTAPRRRGPGISMPYQSDPSMSYARNVIAAAGLSPARVRDTRVSAEEYATITQPNARMSTGGTSVSDLTIGSAAALSGTFPVSMGAAAGMNILFTLAAPTSQEAYNYYFAWLPEKAGHSATQSSTLITDQVNKFIGEELGLNHMIESRTKQYSTHAFEGHIIIREPKCPRKDSLYKQCYIGSGMSPSPHQPWTDKFIGGVNSLQPDFLGGQRGYFIKGSLRDNTISYGKSKVPGFSSIDLWAKISAQLPEEVFFYLAPKKYTYIKSNGKLALGRAPIILNRGKAHYFMVKKS